MDNKEKQHNEAEGKMIEVVGNVIKVKLSEKVKFNDVEVETLELDFASLTGVDICEAETNFRERFFQPIPDANYSLGYQAAVAAKASKLPYELILELKHKDFANVTGAAKGFLLG